MFKAGDRVIHSRTGLPIGTVLREYSEGLYIVEWDMGYVDGYSEDDLILEDSEDVPAR